MSTPTDGTVVVAPVQNSTPKAGVKTTEFHAAITVPYLLTILSMILHKDLTGYTPVALAAVSGVTTVVYVISRTTLKKPTTAAVAVSDARSLVAALEATVSALSNVRTAMPEGVEVPKQVDAALAEAQAVMPVLAETVGYTGVPQAI